MKKFLMIVILAATAALSYYRSAEIYSFYLRVYYEDYKKTDQATLVKEILADLDKLSRDTLDHQAAERLFERAKKGDAPVPVSEKKAAEIKDAVSRAKRISTAYPGNAHARAAAGMALSLDGKMFDGAYYLISAETGEAIPGRFLLIVIKSLYEQQYLSDMISYLEKYGTGGNLNVDYYYGAALFDSGKPKAAIPHLERAYRNGKTDYQVLYKLGTAYCAVNDLPHCIDLLEKAKFQRNRDPEVNRALADAYRRTGRYAKAEEIIREARK